MENTLISQDRLNTFDQLSLNIPEGLIAEVGVYKGGSLKVLAQLFNDRPILGFDTFEGLPKEQWIESEIHQPEEFNDTTLEDVQDFLRDCPNVVLTKGLFPDSGRPFEDQKFALVHLDTDFYLGTKLSLEWFWPRMSKGGVIVLDDYNWPNCPGVKQAVEEHSLKEGIWIHSLANFQAHLYKP